MKRYNDEKTFEILLEERIMEKCGNEVIDYDIWETFKDCLSIMFIDLCGFTNFAKQYGI